MAVKAHVQLGETNWVKPTSFLFFYGPGNKAEAGQDVSLFDLLMQPDMNMLLCDNLLLQMGK